MATLAQLLSAPSRNPQTDPRPWDQPLGGGAPPMPAGGGAAPAGAPPAGGSPDAAMALAQQLAARQQAVAAMAAPATAALQGAGLQGTLQGAVGGLKPNAQGNVEVPAGIFATIMQKLGMGGGGQTPPASGQ